jgi:hypothetical protein
MTQAELNQSVAQLLKEDPKLTVAAAEKMVYDRFVANRMKGPAFDDNEPAKRRVAPPGASARVRARVEASKSVYERTPIKSSAPPPPPPPPPPAEKPAPSSECSRTLESEGITGTADEKKKAYRKFALREHPDKGGDTAKFQKVTGCYEKLIGAGRKTRRRKSHRRR